jgi:flavin reductase (DIM6/NTAB) family NADH-FMN oxidoreductase RutF
VTVGRDLFFRLMGSFASGVTVITSRDEGGTPRGFTASAFCSLSLDPTLCLVSVDLRTESLPSIRTSRAFAVNILASSQEEISRRFASKLEDKFAGLAYREGPATGAPIFDGVLASIECRVREVLPGGDHVIVVGEIVDGEAHEGDPLLYFRSQYRRLAQGMGDGG